ncbi:SfnB family sulfur acquisition oxidoreductase [Rhodococcus globerulus]|uniref:Dibenzothiophene monooxygenase n=1 Tax=Rhodococcus globerulus TaxID=33008 RepID=A0ABU4C3B3_RHOGO|nr:SfnB family sulfur acquisition oxidoreductase [Rhodococcus globerulus]MDV6270989.1 SfnB family sulfur acquisition oxidoreductase [Rhodococcus globerulus]
MAEALETADRLAQTFRTDASRRDANRDLPHEQVRDIARSGLLAWTVPREYGGPDISAGTLAEVFRLLATGDPSIAQIPQSHFTYLEALRLQGTPEQQAFFYGEVLAGKMLANAQSERGPHPISVDTTVLVPHPDGYSVTGRKYYSTGALYADWIVVRASLSDSADGFEASTSTPKALAFIPRDAPGLTVTDDWDGMGQRTTASGTVVLDNVTVAAEHVVPFSGIFSRPTTYGARAQLLHTALDVGIASAALDEGIRQAHRARPHFESNVERAVDDPLLIQIAGDVTVSVRAAQALLREAGRVVDTVGRDVTDDSAAEASIAVATAKVAATRASLEASTVLFELGGTRSAGHSGNLSRFWRDARTHTLHDAIRWKLQHIGRWTLTGEHPPRHGQI